MTGRIKFVSKYRYNSIEFRLHETKQILHTRIGKIIVYKIAYPYSLTNAFNMGDIKILL